MAEVEKKDIYSSIVLVLLILVELLLLWGNRHNSMICLRAAAVGGIILIIILGIGLTKRVFKLEAPTFTKLLTNAIIPSKLGSCFLLGFVMHLSWMTDGVLNYIVGDNWVCPLLIGFVGMTILFIAYPDNKITEDENNLEAVFFSGISKLTPKPVEINHEGGKKEIVLISNYNIEPLVRMLNLIFITKHIKKEKLCKFLILASAVHKQEDFFRKYTDENGNENFLELGISTTEKIDEDLKLFFEKQYGYKTCDEGTNGSIIMLGNTILNLDDLLKTIIRITAILEFPEEKEFIHNNIVVEFTKTACDYDVFDECYNTLNIAVRREDLAKHRLLFNLTPGTGVVGSLMTLFSIDSDRELYYYAQHSNIPKSEKLKIFDKSLISIENLLSQALDKMKGNS